MAEIKVAMKQNYCEQTKIWASTRLEFYFVIVHFMLEMGMIEETSFMAPWLLLG